MIALIPARAGSKRIPGKNTRLLAGHPLIAYTIAAAQQSGVFEEIEVCTDDPAVMRLYSFFKRPPAPDDQADIVWVRDVLDYYTRTLEKRQESFAILRPTSPFRDAGTIRRAVEQWSVCRQMVHSLRAVRCVTEHPGKMWEIVHGAMRPLLHGRHPDGTPWHSSPTQTLPPYYLQTGSLEIAWTRTVEDYGSISGSLIAPFLTKGLESVDLNTEADWVRAEDLVASRAATLPPVALAPVPPDPETPTPADPDRAVAGGSRL